MTLRWLIATIHLLALPLGWGGVWVRGRALGAKPPSLGRAFAADSAWGVAALIWISTGLWRAFGGLEKGSAYYLSNHAFWGKMALLVAILVLEIWPMVTLIRWRIALARGGQPDTRDAPRIAVISVVQAVLVVLMVFAATAMARGMGMPRGITK